MSQKSILILLCGLIAIAIIMLTASLIIACAKPDPSEEQKKKRPIPVRVTYRDLIEMQHPEAIREKCYGGVQGCPRDYGYEDNVFDACWLGKIVSCKGADMICNRCWNREVPEKELRVPDYDCPMYPGVNYVDDDDFCSMGKRRG